MDVFAKTYVNAMMAAPELLQLTEAEAVLYSAPHAENARNEDAAGLWELSDGSLVCVICDGAGGHAGGDEASRAAVEAMGKALHGNDPLGSVLAGFDAANEAVLAMGDAATTMIVALVQAQTLRTFHAGDSAAWLIDRGGRIKHRTIGHTPVDLAREAGLPTNTPTLKESTHIITNYVGSPSLRVDVSHTLTFAPGDTLFLSSDGLLDALSARALATHAARADLNEAAEALTRGAQKASDDCAFMLIRPYLASGTP